MTAPAVSFEFFPPATLPASFRLWESVNRLQVFAPRFMSVTCGAQGAEQSRTLDAAKALVAQTGRPVAGHLTAARASRADVLARADALAQAGITDIVALRGDAAPGSAAFHPHPDGFEHSVELVQTLADQGSFNIYVGAHPEGHANSASQAQNIDWLKAKLDAGATAAITQFFFEAETFLRFRDACVTAGINAPIIPGILPITNWTRARGFALKCGASVPAWLDRAFETARRDGREDLLAFALATELCSDLISDGVDHLHFYTLNNASLSEQICNALGVKAEQTALRNVA